MALNWNLTDILERVANQKTSAPDEKVVTMPGLDKLAKAIRDLQGKLISVEGDEHKLLLAFQEVERESEAMQGDIRQRRAEITEQLRRLQAQMVDAVKSCGIMATVPEDRVQS
jgi:hypothetical protein